MKKSISIDEECIIPTTGMALCRAKNLRAGMSVYGPGLAKMVLESDPIRERDKTLSLFGTKNKEIWAAAQNCRIQVCQPVSWLNIPKIYPIESRKKHWPKASDQALVCLDAIVSHLPGPEKEKVPERPGLTSYGRIQNWILETGIFILTEIAIELIVVRKNLHLSLGKGVFPPTLRDDLLMILALGNNIPDLGNPIKTGNTIRGDATKIEVPNLCLGHVMLGSM